MTDPAARTRPDAQKKSLSLGFPVAFFALLIAVAGGGLFLLHLVPGTTTTVELKIIGIAFAVGLDVLALSIAIGITQRAWAVRLRLGAAFSLAEVLMQVVGYFIGTGAGRIVGVVASYVGFAVLAAVGCFILREGFKKDSDSDFDVVSGWGLVAASASISLDSLGIGVSLPGVPLPLIPLLATVAVSTVIFTSIGLAFGSRLGERYEKVAQRIAGAVLIILAIVFTLQHLEGWNP